jgi:hypothetical protein
MTVADACIFFLADFYATITAICYQYIYLAAS